MDKLNEYLTLKKQYQELRKQPVGNRIKKNGLLEQRIKEKFNRSEEILQRTDEYDYDKYNSIKNRLQALKNELEEEGVISYTEEGEEVIKNLTEQV